MYQSLDKADLIGHCFVGTTCPNVFVPEIAQTYCLLKKLPMLEIHLLAPGK
jgi:hypothetical protein